MKIRCIDMLSSEAGVNILVRHLGIFSGLFSSSLEKSLQNF